MGNGGIPSVLNFFVTVKGGVEEFACSQPRGGAMYLYVYRDVCAHACVYECLCTGM